MKRDLLVRGSLLIVGGLLALNLATLLAASTTNSQGTRTFEYMVVEVESAYNARKDLQEIQTILNIYGRQGWELVESVESMKSWGLIFKR